MGESLGVNSGAPHIGCGPRSPRLWSLMASVPGGVASKADNLGVYRQGWLCRGADSHRGSGVLALIPPRVILKHSGPGKSPRVT